MPARPSSSAVTTSTPGGGAPAEAIGWDLAQAALALAGRLAQGATLWCAAPDWPEHARHVAVEFVHPAVVGARALPALAVEGDADARLRTLARPGDALVVIAPAGSPGAPHLLHEASAAGLTTVWLGSGPRPSAAPAAHVVWTEGDAATARHDGQLVLRYHVLWELTHVCLEHAEVLPTGSGGTAATGADFLYPFLGGTPSDPDALLDDLAASATAKVALSAAQRTAALAANADALAATAASVADRLRRGGRLLTFGNGGSATDAAGLARLFAAPPWGPPWPALSLAEDSAVLTALGNDVGFDLVFARQVLAHGRPADVALGVSTSGGSRNLLAGFEAAARRGLLTVGVAGYGGGEAATSPHVQHCLVVGADSIHRVQEAQAGLGFALWEAVQARVGGAIGG